MEESCFFCDGLFVWDCLNDSHGKERSHSYVCVCVRERENIARQIQGVEMNWRRWVCFVESRTCFLDIVSPSGICGTPTNARVWHMVSFNVGTGRRTIAHTRPAVPKMP